MRDPELFLTRASRETDYIRDCEFPGANCAKISRDKIIHVDQELSSMENISPNTINQEEVVARRILGRGNYRVDLKSEYRFL